MIYLYRIYHKLIAAGFSFTVFVVYLFIAHMNMFEFSHMLKEPLLWLAFYGYGISCSLIIDGILKLKRVNIKSYILYCFFGFIPFIFFDTHLIFILIAGSVGVIAAILFFIGIKYITKSKIASILFSIILPLLLIFISTQDFTKQENWNSTRHDSSFEATFSYFNGEYKIPLDLNQGEMISYNVLFHADNAGGWGYHLENKKGDTVGMNEVGNYLEYDVDEDGTYFIVVRGDQLRGSFTVKWKIE